MTFDISNNSLKLLRKLADQQQFTELHEMCQNFWDETHDQALLPLLALAHFQVGKRAVAETLLQDALNCQPDYGVDEIVDLSALLILFQRLDEAAVMLDQVLLKEPQHALGLARLGYCRMVAEDFVSAETLLQKSIALEPHRIPVFVQLIHLQLSQSNYPAAEQVLQQAFALIERTGAELPQAMLVNQRHQFYGLQLKIWVEQQQFDAAEMWLQEQFKLHQQEQLSELEFIHDLSFYAQLLAEGDLHEQSIDTLREYLKLIPHNINLHLQMAELCQLQGQLAQSINLLRKALKLDKNNIALWVKLAHSSLQRSDQAARQAAEKALELAEALEPSGEKSAVQIKQQLAMARNALAAVESHVQNFDLADTLYRKILAEQKDFIPALQGLAQQQMQRGEIEEAVEIFERIKLLDPLKGHVGLINARHFPEDDETLDNIEKAARVPSLQGSLQAGLFFQLAAAWQKRGDYKKAFELASQGNLASKKSLSYSPKAHRNQCARIRYGFNAELFKHRPDQGVDSTLPVYVVGMPRSGTTLVEQIISGHSEIFGAGELGLIPQVVEGLNRWERHVGSGRMYPDCVDDLIPKVSAGIANNLLEELRELAPEAKHVVDKLPHNFQNIGLIKFLFPRAKIISVRRDPRDIAISNFFTDYHAKHGGMGFAYDFADIGEQLADHNLLMHHWHQLFPGDILEVNYEDVVDDVETYSRKMLDFIGVDWEPEVVNFDQLDRAVKTASVWQVRQPIYKTSKARWTHYQDHLAPLITAANGKIQPDPIEMLSLPQPGFLVEGVELFHQGDLDAAELSFKKMLHHNPEHAACRYMTGMVYLRKGHLPEGIEQIEQALEKTPWQREWSENLQKAYIEVGEHEKAAELESRVAGRQGKANGIADGLNNENQELLDDTAAVSGELVPR
ncbi:MAG TPA: hypothetical protein DCW94_06590 [Porticoccaceae bacterium]|nr:hypothetical protein [Porticoccaceae bacterium]